jgi:hypothetical protein
MKRIITALVALLFSGPVWADKHDSVLLHCSGTYEQKITKSIKPRSRNITIAKDGSWIGSHLRIPRTYKNKGNWFFSDKKIIEAINKKIRKGEKVGNLTVEIGIFSEASIHYETLDLSIEYSGIEGIIQPSIFEGACFPIKNPLKF